MSATLSLAVLVLAATVFATPNSCSITTLSCQNTTTISDTCCFNAPGGQLLLTHFWDSDPSLGPSNSWTIHGLWPDNCDGTYESYCDSSRAYTGSRAALTSAGETDLLSDLDTYWKSLTGDDESFWESEWYKHGTCISTLEKSCYTTYTTKEELIDYYQIAVNTFKSRNTYAILAAAGITPKTSGTYSASSIRSALAAAHGASVTLRCSSSTISEVWYSYYVRGSVQTGEWVAATPVGTADNCSGNIYYYPKSGSPTTTTTTTTSTTTTATPTATSAAFSGSGYLTATTSGTTKGCLISAGTWYVSGTCATFTATASGSGFTLSSSKGNCGVTSGKFVCSSSTTAAVFTAVEGQLAYGGVNIWYGSAVPSGTTQISIYTTSASGRTVAVTLSWTQL